MLKKSLLSLFVLSCSFTSIVQAQGGGCGRLLGFTDLILGRRMAPALLQWQLPLLPRNNEPLAILPPVEPAELAIIPSLRNQNHAPMRRLLDLILGQNSWGQTQPARYSPIQITYPSPILRSDDGIFRSPGSPFPPIGNGNGFIYFYRDGEEDDEDTEIRMLISPEAPFIYQAEGPNVGSEEDEYEMEEGTTPLADGLEQLFRTMHFALGHYRANNLAATPIIAAMDDFPTDGSIFFGEYTFRELIEELLELWQEVESDIPGHLPVEELSRNLFYHLFRAFHSSAIPLENASLERAQVFVEMLTEGAEVNPHRLPDPVILAHLIFEIEGLINQENTTLTFDELLNLLTPLFNREETAFLSHENSEFTPNPVHDSELFETVTYAFLEARASLLLLHLADPRTLQISLFNIHRNIQEFGPQIIEGTLQPQSHSGIALARAFRALLKAQYRFETASTLLWDTQLAQQVIQWLPWQEVPYSNQQFQSAMKCIDLYRIHRKLQPTVIVLPD